MLDENALHCLIGLPVKSGAAVLLVLLLAALYCTQSKLHCY